jgi:Tfp pilus assembly protein PilO
VTARDRLILMVLVVVGALAGFWFLALAPKREEAKSLSAQIATEHQRLDAARLTAVNARQARAQYSNDYATVARLGKAVPTDDGVPSLVYQLDSAAQGAHVDFRSVQVGGGDGAAPTSATTAQQAADLAAAQNGSSAASASAAALPPGVTVGSAGFPTMPFSLTFDGSFFSMQRFFDNVQRLVRVQGDRVNVDGRLLTIDGFSLGAGPKGFPQVSASINATAYLLPADQGLTNGATPQAPAATTASATGSSPGAATATATVTGVK